MPDAKIDRSLAEWNKAAASEEIANLKLIRQFIWEEHTQSYRWLVASLLALNGGACLALFNTDQVHLEAKVVSCGMLVAGAVCALLIAMLGQRSNQASFTPVQQQIFYWMTVERDGERDEEFEVKLAENLKKGTKIGLVARLAGWLSGVLFVTGVVVAGFSMVPQKQSPSMRTAPAIKSTQ